MISESTYIGSLVTLRLPVKFSSVHPECTWFCPLVTHSLDRWTHTNGFIDNLGGHMQGQKLMIMQVDSCKDEFMFTLALLKMF